MLKCLKLISLLSCIYVAYPFVNGMGCDYQSQTYDGHRNIYTTCDMGVIKAVVSTENKKQTISYQGIYGKNGNTIFFWVYKLKPSNIEASNALSLLNSSGLYVAHIVPADGGVDWILLRYPYFDIYKSKRIGSLGFF